MVFRLLLIPLVFATSKAWSQSHAPLGQEKLLIEWSAVEPRVDFLADRVETLDELPFNATVTVLVADDGTEFIWDAWGDRQFSTADFSKNERGLKVLATRSKEFRLFMRLNVPTKSFDWTDDSRWAKALDNIQVLAQMAKVGGVDGIVFDTEQYGEQVFRSKQTESTSNDQSVREMITQRGSDLIHAIEEHLDAPTILLTYAYRATNTDVGDGRDGVDYSLLAPLLDGIVAEAKPTTRIVDGWEYAYGFQEEAKFKTAVDQFLTSTASNPTRERIDLGFGIWLDYAPKKYAWDSQNPEANYFSASKFRETVTTAFDYSDGVVWIYSKRPNWWTNELLHPSYREELGMVLSK